MKKQPLGTRVPRDQLIERDNKECNDCSPIKDKESLFEEYVLANNFY